MAPLGSHGGTFIRRLAFLGAVALAVSGLGASSAHALTDTYWCAAHPGLDPCVVSASFDGSPLTSADPNYDVWAIPEAVAGASTVQWSIQPEGSPDLSAALGHTFSITIDTSVVPRVIDGYGAAMAYTRTDLGGGKYEVTITGQPIDLNDQDGCTFPAGGPTCSEVAPGPPSAVFSGEIDDYDYTNYSSDPNLPAGTIDSFYGMDMYTNIAETGLPPMVVQQNGTNELEIQMADHHFEQDGTTVVHGDFYVRIPAPFLLDFWGINDPSTLLTDGLSASIGSGTVAVMDEPGGAAVDVTITGVTFSPRKLVIKIGKVTPASPTAIKARRLSGSTARVTFKAARPRGQRVTGYALSCRTSGGGRPVSVTGRRSPLTARGLTSSAYRCTLRARSSAGLGLRSAGFAIPA